MDEATTPRTAIIEHKLHVCVAPMLLLLLLLLLAMVTTSSLPAMKSYSLLAAMKPPSLKAMIPSSLITVIDASGVFFVVEFSFEGYGFAFFRIGKIK